MYLLFTLLNFAALISVIVFLVKMIKLKRSGEDNSKAKRAMLSMVAACVITFILMIVTVPKSDTSTETSSNAPQEVILKEETLELPATATTQEVIEETTNQDAIDETTADVTMSQPAAEPDAKETFNKSFSDSTAMFDSEVRNDKTGKWRLYRTSTSEDIVDHAVDYYKAYFASDNELHFIVNLHPQQKTTTIIRVIDEKTLNITEHEYVDKEEFDANELGSGKVIADYFVDIETGVKEKVSE